MSFLFLIFTIKPLLFFEKLRTDQLQQKVQLMLAKLPNVNIIKFYKSVEQIYVKSRLLIMLKLD